ncbi:MAG: NAD(P)H-dependent oxidoreductase [Solirubrobacteraceae bacterium]
MRVLAVYAHPNRKSFCHAVLEQFTTGLRDGGHSVEVVDLYAIKFDPVFAIGTWLPTCTRTSRRRSLNR